jgi:hypothetical protein
MHTSLSIHLVGGPADGQTRAVKIPAPRTLDVEPPDARVRYRYTLRSFFFFYTETVAYVADGMNVDEAGATLFKRLSPPREPRTGPPTMGPTERPRT